MNRRRRLRNAFTLIELTVSLVAGAALLGGLSAALYVAVQATKPRGSDETLDAVRSLRTFADELEFAIRIIDRSKTSIEFVVADRTGDGVEDSIRYQWNGVAGSALTRSLNGGSDLTVAEDVQDFSIDYRIKVSSEAWQVQNAGEQQSLALNISANSPIGALIDSNVSIGQFIHPRQFAVSVPNGTQTWSINKVRFMAKASGSRDGALWVQIRETDAHHQPTSTVLSQIKVAESELNADSYGLKEVTFDPPIRNISIFDGVCLVFSEAEGDAVARIIFELNGNGNRVYSTDNEQTWSVSDRSELIYRLTGSLSQLDSRAIGRKYAVGAAAELRIGTIGQKFRQSFQIPNCPELLEDSWRADFESDPTSLDGDFNGTHDWTYGLGGAFDANELWHGTWKTTGAAALTTADDSDFATLTTVETSFRDLDTNNGGVVVWINADWEGSTYAPVIAELSLLDDGTQTLTVKTTEDGSDRILTRLGDLPPSLTHVRMTIEPTLNVINLVVNHVEVATFDYEPQIATHSHKRAGVMSLASAFQIDWLSVQTVEAP